MTDRIMHSAIRDLRVATSAWPPDALDAWAAYRMCEKAAA